MNTDIPRETCSSFLFHALWSNYLVAQHKPATVTVYSEVEMEGYNPLYLFKDIQVGQQQVPELGIWKVSRINGIA